jgi:hypothetical protein
LFVAQYRNSDFTRMQRLPNCRPYGNGFIMDSLRGYSFYGLIPSDNLASLVKRGGFVVESLVLDEGTVYLWAKSPEDVPGPVHFSIRETAENFQIRAAAALLSWRGYPRRRSPVVLRSVASGPVRSEAFH